MRFFLCEIEHAKGSHLLALPTKNFLGVSATFVPAPDGERAFGFAEYEERLYPVVTHADLEKPIFKYFAVYQNFAFGVTRILAEVESTPTPLTKTSPHESLASTGCDEILREVSHYTGIIVHEGQVYYVYNFSNVKVPNDAIVEKVLLRKVTEQYTDTGGDFIVLGGKYAVRKDRVKTILSANLVTPFKTEEFDGFIDYERVIPVKNLDTGDYVVVLENVAYRTGKVYVVSGTVLEHPEKGEKILETDAGVFKIVE